jgi:hypothetical protein
MMTNPAQRATPTVQQESQFGQDPGDIQVALPALFSADCTEATREFRTRPDLQVRWFMPLRAAGPESDPTARLLGQVELFGVLHHIDLTAIRLDGDLQVVDCPEEECLGEEMFTVVGGALDPVMVNGRLYGVLIYPYGY